MDNYYPPQGPPNQGVKYAGDTGSGPGGGRRLLPALIIILVVALLAAGYYYWKYKRPPAGVGGIEYGGRAGELAPGFPPELIPEINPNIIDSTHTEYENGNKIDVAVYTVQKTLSQNIAAFNLALRSNDWFIEREADQNQQITSIFARKPGAETTVILEKLAAGETKVTVTRTLWK